MHESTLDGFFRQVAEGLAVPREAVAAMLVVAGCLAVTATAIGVRVLITARGEGIRWERAAGRLGSVLWILPVVAVLPLLVVPALDYFQTDPLPPASDLPAKGDEAELGEPAGAEEGELLSDASDRQSDSEADDGGLPEWVGREEVTLPDGRFVVVSGGQFAQVEAARADALREAVQTVKDDFRRTGGRGYGRWDLPADVVHAQAVRREHVESITRQTENNPFRVHRVHLQVALTPEVHDAVYPVWRQTVVQRRLWVLGCLLAFAVLTVGTVAAYLRLDALTSGSYRRPLKLASVSLLVAGGLGLAVLLPLA